MATIFKNACTKILADLDPRSMFITVRDYENEYGEVSHFSVGFHADYKTAVAKSLKIVQSYSPSFKDCIGQPFTIWDLEQAKQELILSYEASLGNVNSNYTCRGVYDSVSGRRGVIIPGVKLHLKNDILYLEGLRLAKRVIVAGIYSSIKSQPITLAKNLLRSKTPVDRWGQFKLMPGKFSVINLGKMSFSDQETVRI